MNLFEKAENIYPRISDPVTRRTFGKIFLGVAAGGVAAPLMMKAVSAEAANVVDCATYMFHMESTNVVGNVINANLRDGRTPVTASQLTRIIRDEEAAPAARMFCLTFDDGYLNKLIW